jgi:hypothetical protein
MQIRLSLAKYGQKKPNMSSGCSFAGGAMGVLGKLGTPVNPLI